MKKLFLLIIIFNIFQKIESQNILGRYKDSIATLNIPGLIDATKPTLYVDSLKAKIVFNEMLKKLSKNEVSKINKLLAYKSLFHWEYSQNNFKEAICYANFVYELAEETNNHYYSCFSLIVTGLSYFEIGDYDLAVKYNFDALDMAIKYKILKLEFAAKANIGKFKLDFGDYKGSITILENIFKTLKKTEIDIISEYTPETYYDLTLAYLKEGNIGKATYYNKLAQITSKKYNFYIKKNIINEAKIEIEKGDYSKALELLNNSEKIEEHSFHKFNIIADFHLTKGKAYFFKGDYNNALNEFLALEKLENNKRINHLNFQEGFSYIAKVYKALNNKDLALRYYTKALASFTETERSKLELISKITNKYDKNEIDKILTDKNLTQSVYILKKHEAIKKEINSINNEKKQKSDILLRIIFILLTLISLSSFFVLRNKKRNKKKLNELLSKISEKEYRSTQKKEHKNKINLEINELEVQRIVKELNKFEKEEYFLNTDCTAVNLSKKLETNTTYLSKIINSYYQKNFSKYINDLRIDYVINRLQQDKLFRRYSIHAIANEIGFKSKESFNSAFKKQTGILPSYFIKEIENN